MWYEQDDFWRDNYEVMFSADSFRRAAEDVDRVLSLTGAAPRQVLDLCCGPGRYSIPLAQTGLAVTAVDLSSFLLDAARKNARAAGVSLEFIHSDMRHFLRPRSFDLILHLYSSFGYFDSRDDDMKVLSNMFETLRPGGTVIIDVVGKELIGRRSDRITELPDGSTCIQRNQIINEWTTLDAEWILIRKDFARRSRFRHRLYSGYELRVAMESVGFEVRLLGDFEGSSYGSDSPRLVAVGRKPAAASHPLSRVD